MVKGPLLPAVRKFT